MQSAHGLFAAMWETGLWRYFTFLLIYSIGVCGVGTLHRQPQAGGTQELHVPTTQALRPCSR